MALVTYPSIGANRLPIATIAPYPEHFELYKPSRLGKDFGRASSSGINGRMRGFIRFPQFRTDKNSNEWINLLADFMDDMFDPVRMDPYTTLPISEMTYRSGPADTDRTPHLNTPTTTLFPGTTISAQTTNSDNEVVTTLGDRFTGPNALKKNQYFNIEIDSKILLVNVKCVVADNQIVFRPYHRVPTGTPLTRATSLTVKSDRTRERPIINRNARQQSPNYIWFFEERTYASA